METQSKTFEEDITVNPVLADLLADLRFDPFARSHGFENLSFEDIGLILEEPVVEDPQVLESFDRCKSIYCLVLHELELLGHSEIPQILKEVPLTTLFPVTAEPLRPEPEPQPTIPPVNDFQENPANTTQAVFDSELVASPELQLTPTADLQPAYEIPAATTDEIPVASVTPDLKPNQAQPESLHESFLKIAEFFTGVESSSMWNLAAETKLRLSTQFSILACEVAIFRQLKEDMAHFWPERNDKILGLLKPDSFEFLSDYLNLFSEHEKQYAHLLFDGNFPRLAAIHCLKYLTLTKSIDKLHPTVFELATFIYFWGGLKAFTCPTHEICPTLSRLTSEQLIEISLRLFRLDRIKALSINFNREFTEELGILAEEDTREVLRLTFASFETYPERHVA